MEAQRLLLNEPFDKVFDMGFDLSIFAGQTVELPGIEPGSYGIPSRLLRAQFAMPLLGSLGHTN
jgi:hypothetical protein